MPPLVLQEARRGKARVRTASGTAGHGRRSHPRTFVALAVLCSIGTAHLAAQGIVQGIVTDQQRPVEGAEVLVEALDVATRTNRSGTFELRLPAGRQAVLVRAIGFYPISMVVTVSDTAIVDLEFELQRRPQVLDSVVTRVDAPNPVRGRMAGFEERRKQGVGDFITREQLATREHSRLSDVLRMTGIPTIRRPPACGGGYAIGSNRGYGGMRVPSWMHCAGAPIPIACYMTIYLDGILIWTPGRSTPPNVDDFAVHSIEAVEVYRGFSHAPVEYQAVGTTCGVVLLWTRES